jgi:hypothetical protein
MGPIFTDEELVRLMNDNWEYCQGDDLPLLKVVRDAVEKKIFTKLTEGAEEIVAWGANRKEE